MKGWIKLYRSFSSWKFYKNSAIKDLFLHILLNSAYEKFKTKDGIVVKRGFLLSSIRQLADETGLSAQQVRTALKKLEAEKCITVTTTKKCTLIGVVNYSAYQGYDFSAEREAEPAEDAGAEFPFAEVQVTFDGLNYSKRLSQSKDYSELFDSWEAIQNDKSINSSERAELWQVYRMRAEEIAKK